MTVPKEVLDKAPKSRDYHLYLEIKINNKWVRVDCSDDPKLKLVEWDGKTDTKISVKCLRVLSPKKSAKIEENERKNYDNVLKEYHEFYLALNKFLEKIRNRQGLKS